MNRFLLLVLLLLGMNNITEAQKSLRSDSIFFQEQVPVYENWLNRVGFGQFLKVQELLVFDEYIVLNLAFRSIDLEEMVASWQALKEGFESKSSISLEEELFYQAAAMMELQDTMLAVGVYNTYNRLESPTFYREILFVNGAINISGDNPKAVIKAIKVFPRDLNSGTLSSVVNFQKRLTREKVYQCISAFLEERFATSGYGGDSPEVILKENRDHLRLEVINLRKEVLSQTSLCNWLEAFGLDCRWAKREKLSFLFTYEQTPTGIQLTGDISGKVGAGLYQEVSRGSYRDMEPDFDQELQAYIKAITTEIIQELENCR